MNLDVIRRKKCAGGLNRVVKNIKVNNNSHNLSNYLEGDGNIV